MEHKLPIALRWADFDANFHLRHSAYYDFGATARLELMQQHGLTYELMQRLHIGPVLFREEALFKREVRPNDQLFINLQVTKMRRDFSRWSFRHEITRADGTLCAILSVDGAWIDTHLRKLAAPPDMVVQAFDLLDKAPDFQWEEVPQKG